MKRKIKSLSRRISTNKTKINHLTIQKTLKMAKKKKEMIVIVKIARLPSLQEMTSLRLESSSVG